MPTMAYLMGFEELDTVYFGQNLLTAEKGFVAQTRYAPRGSFITDDIVFMMSFDMVFENSRHGPSIPERKCRWRLESCRKVHCPYRRFGKMPEEDSIAELYPSGGDLGATAEAIRKNPCAAAGENSEEADGDE